MVNHSTTSACACDNDFDTPTESFIDPYSSFALTICFFSFLGGFRLREWIQQLSTIYTRKWDWLWIKKKTAYFSQTNYDMSFMLSFQGLRTSRFPAEYSFGELQWGYDYLFDSFHELPRRAQYTEVFQNKLGFCPSSPGGGLTIPTSLKNKINIGKFLWFF